MENFLTGLFIFLLTFFAVAQIYAHKYDIRDFFQKIYFNEDHHNMRKNVRYSEKRWTTYFERKKDVERFVRSYNLSTKEILWCLKSISDVDHFEDLHLELLKMLKEKGFFKKTVHPVFDFFKHLKGYEFRKLQNIAWH